MSKRLSIALAVLALAIAGVMPVAAGAAQSDYETTVHIRGATINGSNGVAIDNDGRLLVGSVGGREIVALDRQSGAVLERITDGVDGADDVAIGPDGSIYWTDIFIGEVGRLAPDGTVTKPFVAPGMNPIAFSADGRLFVGQAFFGDGLYEVDPDLEDPPRVVIADSGIPPFLSQLNGFDFGPDGMLYAPQLFMGTILKINPDSGATEVIASGLPGPGSVEFDSNWNLYTNTNTAGTVLLVDTATGDTEVVANIPGVSIDNMVFDDRDRLFVSDWQTGGIYSISPSGLVRTLLPGGMMLPGGVAVMNGAPGGASLFVADVWSLREFAARTGKFRSVERQSFFNPDGIVAPQTVSADGDALLISSWFGNAVQVWDPVAGVALERYDDFAIPLNAIRFQGDLIVAELGTSSIVRQDAAGARTTMVTAPDVFVPAGLAATDDDLWVADWATGLVWQLVADGVTLAAPQLTAAGLANPEGMAVDDGTLLVVETGTGTLTRIDPSTGATSMVADGLAVGASASAGAPPTWMFSGVAVGVRGEYYVSGDVDNVIYRIIPVRAGD